VASIKDVKAAFDHVLGECQMPAHDRLRLRIVIYEILGYWDEEREKVDALQKRVEQLEAEVRRLGEGR
jgi:hypothetical protein